MEGGNDLVCTEPGGGFQGCTDFRAAVIPDQPLFGLQSALGPGTLRSTVRARPLPPQPRVLPVLAETTWFSAREIALGFHLRNLGGKCLNLTN